MATPVVGRHVSGTARVAARVSPLRARLRARSEIGNPVRKSMIGSRSGFPLGNSDMTRLPVTPQHSQQLDPAHTVETESVQPDMTMFRVLMCCAESSLKVCSVHEAGLVLSQSPLTASGFQWMREGEEHPAAAGESSVDVDLLCLCSVESAEEYACDDARNGDVQELAAAITECIAAATLYIPDSTATFGMSARAKVQEALLLFGQLPISLTLQRTLELALTADEHHLAPSASRMAKNLALEAVRVLALGEYRASAAELDELRELLLRLGMGGMEKVAQGSAEVVRMRVQEVKQARLRRPA
jgi:hypothetical protein